MREHDYPGNVRELENIIERAVILCKGEVIEVQHLPEELQLTGRAHSNAYDNPAVFQAHKQRAIEQFERTELTRILALTGGKVRESARLMGMDAKNFSEKLKRYGMRAEDFKP